MTMTQSPAIKQLFNRYADEFDSIYGDSRNAFQRWIDNRFRQSMRIRFEKTIACCRPIEGKTVLDVGCGPGHYSVLLASQGAAKVLGVDVAPRMVELARTYAKQKGVEGRCQFLETDIMQYHPETPFDYTIVMGIMDYISEPESFIRHLMALTRSMICLSFPDDAGFLAWQRRLRYRWDSGCELSLYAEDRLRSLLESIAPKRYTLEHISRDYFVKITVE